MVASEHRYRVLKQFGKLGKSRRLKNFHSSFLGKGLFSNQGGNHEGLCNASCSEQRAPAVNRGPSSGEDGDEERQRGHRIYSVT